MINYITQPYSQSVMSHLWLPYSSLLHIPYLLYYLRYLMSYLIFFYLTCTHNVSPLLSFMFLISYSTLLSSVVLMSILYLSHVSLISRNKFRRETIKRKKLNKFYFIMKKERKKDEYIKLNRSKKNLPL